MASQRKEYLSECQRCGKIFYSKNVRRLYCSDLCRRKHQDEERKERRAEEAEAKAALAWAGELTYAPWETDDPHNVESIFQNSITDGWTATRCGLTMCQEEQLCGAMACNSCTRYGDRKDKRPFPYGQSFTPQPTFDSMTEIADAEHGHKRKAGAMPPRKEVARAKRRHRKRRGSADREN